ncbi:MULTISPECIES: WD40 repeat domain-containing protein [unclassified Streptomyces]|uniref:WD40 repeat domain-containing protein n=1 Tax=unclassified Streptomyces TaxID=2593676 RepID=UPI0026A23C49
MVIAADGTWLATASGDAVRVWDRATGTCTATLGGHTGSVLAVVIAPGGTWLATTADDGTVRIWDAAEGRTVAIARADGALHSCAWGPAHELVVGGQTGLCLFELLT